MGFLSGAYGKIMAGKYLRNLQFKETMVQARLRHVTKEMAQMDKMLSAQERCYKDAARQDYINTMQEAATAAGIGINGSTPTQQSMMDYSNKQMMAQMNMSMLQSSYESYFELQREAMLQPLKDEEDAIQTELDSLKSQIQLAQAEYDAKKEEEKAGAKNIAPDYTGQA